MSPSEKTLPHDPVAAEAPSSEYEIRRVVPRDIPRVAELLRHLTGADSSWNRDYLSWKYLNNPFVERPLGIVALAGNDVVGFRGYHATPWQVPTSGYRTLVLTPGDTCVDPEHRRRGLSVQMGRMGMRELHPDHRVFLNMTAGASSVPGYLRMGFVPLQDKSRMTLMSPLRAARDVLRSRRPPVGGKKTHRGAERFSPSDRGSPSGDVEYGEFGDLEVTPDPLPEEMARVAMARSPTEARLTALQDERFFRWYFRAPVRGHVFYYARDRGRVTGYVILQVADSGQLATIIDYSRRSLPPVAEILRFLARSKPFGLIWIYDFTPDPELRRLLHELGFRSNNAIERIRRRMKRVWPLLVRPVRAEPTEDDWFVEGLNIRATSSWDIREIRSDAI